MRRFAFRLQRALRFALLREHQRKIQVVEGRRKIGFLKKYLGQLEEQILKNIEESNRGVGTLLGEAHFQAVVPVMGELKRFQGLLEEELSDLANKQNGLKQASQRRRSLESLREKRKQEFKQERSRREQKTVDAIGIQSSFSTGELD